jgi:hypothetical protein
MRSVAIFISAFFYCAATAVASQPVKLALGKFQKGKKGLLQGRVQPAHKKDVHVALKDGAGKLLFKGAPLKTATIKIKKDPHDSDRRLAKEGSIRGRDIIDSVPRERTLHDLKKNSAFEANVVVPLQFQGKSEKTSGGSGRRLQEDFYCEPLDDGSLACCQDNLPSTDFMLCLICPADVVDATDCYDCAILSDVGEMCDSCTMCSDTVAYDCSNIVEDAIQDCDSTPPPDDPDEPSEVPCSEMADGSLACRLEDYPVDDFHVDFSCPADATDLLDCSSCAIASDDNVYECNSCTICSDTVAYDCSNIAEGDCVVQDCSGNCESSTSAPPAPPKPTPTDDPHG